MTKSDKLNLAEKLSKFDETWSPKVIAELNDYQVKLAKLEGEFVWHSHTDTDEMFICLAGQFSMHYRHEEVVIKAGEMIVVPRGVEHRPVAAETCSVMIIEPRGVVNTGASDGALTAEQDQWI